MQIFRRKHSSAHSSSRIGDIAARVAGRRAKWIVIAIWVLLAIASGPVQGLLASRSTNDSANSLPKAADSTKVIELLRDESTFDDGQNVPAIIVFQSTDGGEAKLTGTQRDAITRWVGDVDSDRGTLPTATSITSAATAKGPMADALSSKDGTTELAFVNLESPKINQLDTVVTDLRDRAKTLKKTADIDVYVSGPAALGVDAVDAFGGIDVKLILGTSILVLVLLLLIYRSPLIALVPLIAVGIAAALSRVVLGLAINPFDLVVSGQTSGIMLILIFGAGTDYCLLIVSRYREELVRFSDHHDAMRETVRHTTPAILSSAGTVVLGMLVLLTAELRSTSSLGPALIIGVTISMLAGLTLLPALLLTFGRRSFWPFTPRYGHERTTRFDLWATLASRISARPVIWLVTVVVVLLVASGGILTQKNHATSELDLFIHKPESVQGLNAMHGKLPAGDLAQGTVLIGGKDAQSVRAATGAVTGILHAADDIDGAFPGATGSKGNTTWQQVSFVPDSNPYGSRAVDSIEDLRTVLDKVATKANLKIYVGGPTAETADTQTTNRRDLRIIVPGLLAVITLVLVLLLGAVVAPIFLMLTVVLGYGATLGICWVLFLGVLDFPGLDPGVLTFIFLFTAALGIDYNIFLVARIREEAQRGATTADATRTALAVTGSVITSAGVILAGTFLILATLPLLPLRELGIAVAIGVLLDTILVRAIIVPAAITLLGDRAWWPWPKPGK